MTEAERERCVTIIRSMEKALRQVSDNPRVQLDALNIVRLAAEFIATGYEVDVVVPVFRRHVYRKAGRPDLITKEEEFP